MTRSMWIALGLTASLALAFTALAKLPSNQVDSRGVYVQFDGVSHNIDRANGFPVAGGHWRWEWKDLEPNYDDDYRFDEEIRGFILRQASRGKKAAIGFETYVKRNNQAHPDAPYGALAVPEWLYQTYENVALWNPRGAEPHYYALNFLDADYQAKYAEFVGAFANWLAANPDLAGNVAWVEIGVGMDSETQPGDYWKVVSWPDYVFYNENLGWTGEDWIAYVNWSVDTYHSAFRIGNPSLSHIPLFLNCAPTYPSHPGYVGNERTVFTDYAASKGIGLKNNGLQADRAPAALYGPLEKWGAAEAPATVPIAFETYEQWLTNEAELYWGLLCALDKHPDVLEPDRWLLVDRDYQRRDNYVAIWDWVEPYVSVTPNNTPGIWCALRETEHGNGERGNFRFWLYERGDLPGGATVPEWNVTDAKEGRYTRRTDQATGNRFMHFQVLNTSAFYGNPGPVTVQVTYLDRGTDSWRLTYDSITGEQEARTIQKGDSDQWVTVAIPLTDARFGNGYHPVSGGGTAPDLKIDCMGDGDEYVHMVEVKPGPHHTIFLPLIVR